ncbi:MAG: polysaccharide deacetylase family protein [Pseudomonadota bacterium]
MSIHDVAPANWSDCLRLLRAVREVADIPLTWLVVPHFHGSEVRAPACDEMLACVLSEGHELALHGYTHLDALPQHASLRARFVRKVYTQGEGEFAALDTDEARRRLGLGLAWFARRGWPVSGFVAPAWLLGKEAWRAVETSPFDYTTTMSRFHLLPTRRSVFSPSLMYAARNGVGRRLSPPCASLLASMLAPAPLIRLSLHPRDARHPALLRHAQGLIERLLAARTPMTKAAFARRLSGLPVLPTLPTLPTNTAPSPHRSPSASAQSRHSSADSHTVRHPPWHSG